MKHNEPYALETGDKVDQYVILEKKDESDLHTSYTAVEPAVARHVTIKILHGPYITDSEQIFAFKNFARLLSNLHHTHLIPLLSIGQIDGFYYVANDYIQGYNLRDWLFDNRVYDEQQALRFLRNCTEVLGYAAKQNIIHLDLRPISFVVDWDNNFYIANLGIAQLRNFLAGKNSHDSLAKPHYSAPEQIEGKTVDFRTDIYTLGCVLFHLMTGHYPYDAETNDRICLEHLTKPFPRGAALESGIHEDWIDLLEKMMAKDPADRFQAYGELEEAAPKLPVD